MEVERQQDELFLYGGDVLSWDGSAWVVKKVIIHIRGDRIVNFPDRLPLEPWVPYNAALDVAVDLQPEEVESIVGWLAWNCFATGFQ